MSSCLHAAHYADRAVRCQVGVEENQRVARDTFRLRVRCREIAERALPGQFIMVRLSGCDDPLIGRALAIYDILPASRGSTDGLDLVYHVKGKFTRRLARQQPGQMLDIWGPLGNGFPSQSCHHLVMVAGGVGQTPFLTLAKEHLGHCRYGQPARYVPRVANVTLCYGAQSRDLLAGVKDFVAQGVVVRVATDDGSAGHHGLVTDLLEQVLDEESTQPAADSVRVVCCGPEPMMQAVSRIAAAHDVPCLVSLETPMACGIGICFSCVTKVIQEDGTWDYKRTCVEGPVFDAKRIAW